MTAIRIERLSDTHDCETCGWTCADGARVYFDGVLALELLPHAHCFDGDNFNDEDIYKRIIEALGHSVSWDGEVA